MRLPTRPRTIASAVVTLALAAGILGCPSTFRYRSIQSEFIAAAQADNEASVDPFAGSTAVASYESILAELTPARIDDLDPKLRGNAWVIRSYAEWRSGQYADAIKSADLGLGSPGLGPRDRMLLELLPALAVDSEAKRRWDAKGQTLTAADYAPFRRDFAAAYGQLQTAAGLADASTARSTVYYVAYQRWRILTDWRIVIASIDREDVVSAARTEARVDAEHVVGGPLQQSATAARDAIPPSHPLRQLIAAQGG